MDIDPDMANAPFTMTLPLHLPTGDTPEHSLGWSLCRHPGSGPVSALYWSSASGNLNGDLGQVKHVIHRALAVQPIFALASYNSSEVEFQAI